MPIESTRDRCLGDDRRFALRGAYGGFRPVHAPAREPVRAPVVALAAQAGARLAIRDSIITRYSDGLLDAFFTDAPARVEVSCRR